MKKIKNITKTIKLITIYIVFLTAIISLFKTVRGMKNESKPEANVEKLLQGIPIQTDEKPLINYLTKKFKNLHNI